MTNQSSNNHAATNVFLSNRDMFILGKFREKCSSAYLIAEASSKTYYMLFTEKVMPSVDKRYATLIKI